MLYKSQVVVAFEEIEKFEDILWTKPSVYAPDFTTYRQYT